MPHNTTHQRMHTYTHKSKRCLLVCENLYVAFFRSAHARRADAAGHARLWYTACNLRSRLLCSPRAQTRVRRRFCSTLTAYDLALARLRRTKSRFRCRASISSTWTTTTAPSTHLAKRCKSARRTVRLVCAINTACNDVMSDEVLT